MSSRKRKNQHNSSEQALKLLEDRGRLALEIARKAVLEEKIRNKTIREALNYYMLEVWVDIHHAGLLSVACEAVGGKPDETTKIGAATILLRGAIDIHDDIIDQQIMKADKPTIYGKYGKDIALLAGNALLFKGSALLNEAITPFPEENRKTIIDLIKSAFFEIGDAVASEIDLRRRPDLLPEEYMEVIKGKAAGAEVHMRIGAIVGGGTRKEIEALGKFGRILGILATIRDEFVDLYEPRELQNRMKKECLPLPVLYAFKNKQMKKKIVDMLEKKKMAQKDAYEILDIVSSSREVKELKKEMQLMMGGAFRSITHIRRIETRNILCQILSLAMRDI